MPPDRTQGTTSSFAQAIATGAPLSSVGPNHAPTLERGKACTVCRRRRVRCDGMRPTCGRCARSAKAHGEDPSTIICEYDSSVPKKPPAPKESDRVAELAAEVAALKQQLLQQQAAAAASASSSSTAPAQTPYSTSLLPQPPAQYHPQQSYASSSSVTLDQHQHQHQHNQPPPPQEHFSMFSGSSLSSVAPPIGNEPIFDAAAYLTSAASASTPAPSHAAQNSGVNVDSPSGAFAAYLMGERDTPHPSQPTSGVGGAGGEGVFSGLADLADLAASSSTGAGRPHPQLSVYEPHCDPSAATPAATDPAFDPFAWALLPPSYPATLPSPPLLNRLLSVYFSKRHLASEMVSEARLRAALLLPRDDPRAPLECFLHAIAATAGLMVGEAFLEGEVRYWAATPEGGDGMGKGTALAFSEYHFKRANELLDASFTAGRNLLQVVQSACLLVFCAYTSARFSEIWHLNARASRLAVITGLNHILPTRDGQERYDAEVRANRRVPRARKLRDASMLPPPRDEEEMRERLSTFWVVMGSDRMTAAATDWACTLSEEDITSLLPTPNGVGAIDWSDHPLSSPLCLHNPSFFFANPQHLVGPLQLYIKGIVLLGRVCGFLQRAPEPVGAGYPLPDGVDLRETPAFRALERTITHFRLSIPRDLQYAYVLRSEGRFDNRLLLVSSLTHVVVILMHEPFCISPTTTAEEESFRKCLEAAKAIVAAVYEISGSSYEIGLLASFLNWIWAVAGRTLVRALALASRRSDLTAASHLAMDVKALISAMEANKSPVGAVTASILQRLLTDPFQVLPDSPPASSRHMKNFSSKHTGLASSSLGGGSGGLGSLVPDLDGYGDPSEVPGFNNIRWNSLQGHAPTFTDGAYHPARSQGAYSPSAGPGSAGRTPIEEISDTPSSGGGGRAATTAVGYPGSIWEVLDDPTPEEMAQAKAAGGEKSATRRNLDEVARVVLEKAQKEGTMGVLAAAMAEGVGLPLTGWP
ncbi:hypothetical protein JCM8097_005743 [Rhodosporidiobolus ruineniae]